MRTLFLIPLLLILTACSTSNVVTTLDAVVAATDVLIQAIPNVPANVKADVLAYSSEVATAVSCAAPELNSADPSAEKASKVLACFQAVKLPGGEAFNIVAAVAAAVQAFLAPFQPVAPVPNLKLSAGDKSKLIGIEKKAQAQSAAIRHFIVGF